MIQFKQGEDPVRLLSVCEQKQLIKKIMKSKAYFSRKSKVWKKLASLGYYVGVWYYRKSFLVDQLKMKKERSKGTSVDKNEILRIWNGIKVDNGWFRFYNSVLREGNNSFDARYIPLDIQYCYIDDWFNDTESALILDDKNMYDLYFYDVNRPNQLSLYEITSCREMSGQQLKEIDYPTKKPGKSYMTFKLVESSLDAKQLNRFSLIDKITEDHPEYIKGTPVFLVP